MNHTLSANHLTSLEDAKGWLGIKNDEKDELLTLVINAATSFIEKYCNRHFISASYTETFDGEDKKNLYLRESPVTAVASVKDDGTTLTVDQDYYVYDDEGRIEKASGVWGHDPQNYVVAYTAGYASASLPADIKGACLSIVSAMYNERNRGGVKRESYGSGYSVEYVDVMKTVMDNPFIKGMLDPYKRRYVG